MRRALIAAALMAVLASTARAQIAGGGASRAPFATSRVGC